MKPLADIAPFVAQSTLDLWTFACSHYGYPEEAKFGMDVIAMAQGDHGRILMSRDQIDLVLDGLHQFEKQTLKKPADKMLSELTRVFISGLEALVKLQDQQPTQLELSVFQKLISASS